MSYDEEQHRRSRVVVETPTARREVVQQQTVRYPPERRGYSTGVLVTVALVAIAATAILFLFLTNSGGDAETNVNVRAAMPAAPTPVMQQPVIVQPTPMTMPTPLIIQAPPVTTAPPPVIVQAPPTTTDPGATAPPASSTAPPASANDDATIQQKIDKAFADDASVASANIDAIVISGKVVLTGTVATETLKQRAERLAYGVKGVRSVENRIAVTPAP